ncbi:MAG TPA: Imm52 family immunity protein [Stellaceae bacterium]|nr:Imm52 family immunity protein [Stellaceae bacterium]
MKALFDIFVNWPPRPESSAACTERLISLLETLQSIDPVFARWATVGRASRKLKQPFDIDEMTKLVEGGRHYIRGESGRREVNPSLGFGFGLWNSENAGRTIGMHASLGMNTRANMLGNEVSFKLGSNEDPQPAIFTLPLLRPALLTMARICDATWGTVTPYGIFDFGPKPHPPRCQFLSGWMTYLSAPYAALVTPPRSVIVEQQPDGGILMISTEEVFDPENPRHFAAACDIQAALAPLNARPWPLILPE